MKKTLRFVGMALMAVALSFCVTSCGDDDVPVPDVDKTANGNNGVVDFRDGSDNPVPYPTHFSLAEGKYIELSVCDVNAKKGEKLAYLDDGSWSIDYDSDYFMIRLASNYSDADNGTFLFIRALKTTNGKELPITLNYSFKGQKFKTVFYVTVTTKNEDAKEGNYISCGGKKIEIEKADCEEFYENMFFTFRAADGVEFEIETLGYKSGVEYDLTESGTHDFWYFMSWDHSPQWEKGGDGVVCNKPESESLPTNGTFKYTLNGTKCSVRLNMEYDEVEYSVVWDGQLGDSDESDEY